jgi:diguanylate cyclase (GGDEF)-like protein
MEPATPSTERRLDGTFDFTINPWSTEFRSRETELAFTAAQREHFARGYRRLLILGFIGVAMTIAGDFASPGPDWTLIPLRLVFMVSAIVAYVSLRRPAASPMGFPRLLVFVHCCAWVTWPIATLFRPDPYHLTLPQMAVAVVGMLVIVPQRFVWGTITVGVLFVPWFALYFHMQDIPARGMGVVLQSAVMILVVSAFASHRLSVGRREDWATRLTDAALTARLSEEVAWRMEIEEELVRRANVDPLTGTATRRHLVERGDDEFALAKEHALDVSVLIVDVDHFKTINDTFGHAAGDEVLTGIAEVMRHGLRERDILGRFGGEEFVAILPETSVAEALDVGERLRAAVAAYRFDLAGMPVHCTVSVGVTGCRPASEAFPRAVERADLALYRAKDSGRNRVEVQADDLPLPESIIEPPVPAVPTGLATPPVSTGAGDSERSTAHR